MAKKSDNLEKEWRTLTEQLANLKDRALKLKTKKFDDNINDLKVKLKEVESKMRPDQVKSAKSSGLTPSQKDIFTKFVVDRKRPKVR